MANAEQLALLKAGIEGWNEWREKEPGERIELNGADLSGANLSGANFIRANLERANLTKADLRGAFLMRANLNGADLTEAYLRRTTHRLALARAALSKADLGLLLKSDIAILMRANISGTNLSEAHLIRANLTGADLEGVSFERANLTEARLMRANLNGANLFGANLSGADLSSADLSGANLTRANLSEANLSEAILSDCNLLQANISNAKISKSNVYGINVWDLEGDFKEQKDLIITSPDQPSITVDNIKVAQFIYLILNNEEIRDVINTLTSKTVLILGRFALPERKAILDALRDKLRDYNLLPIVFDFDRPTDKDFTETIKTLAGISYFVIADVTNPKSSPLELQATVPDYQIPFVPIIQEGEYPFAMMIDLQKKYNWVLDTISYDSLDTLIEILKPYIIDPALKKHDELRLIKAKEPTIISGKDLLSKK